MEVNGTALIQATFHETHDLSGNVFRITSLSSRHAEIVGTGTAAANADAVEVNQTPAASALQGYGDMMPASQLELSLPQTPQEIINLLRFRWYWIAIR